MILIHLEQELVFFVIMDSPQPSGLMTRIAILLVTKKVMIIRYLKCYQTELVRLGVSMSMVML